ncbi:MAG: hypothetical protein GXO26_04725 [Crenarchaeota archaeon]|nr:hypothetical protein [Thermoproteota archaeon]
MRIIAYAITLLAGIASALLIIFALSKVGILGPVCMSCILSRSVIVYPGSVESHNSYITIGGIAIPNISNIHVHGHEIISQGVSKIPNQSPIIRIGPPRVHGPGSNGPPCRTVRHVHELYRVALYLTMISHGYCGVTNRVKIVATIHIEDNRTLCYNIEASKIEGYVRLSKLNKTAIRVNMEDCSCCDFDYRDEIYIINLKNRVLVLYLVQAKGGYSHDVYINSTLWFTKPPGAWMCSKTLHVTLRLTRKWVEKKLVCH